MRGPWLTGLAALASVAYLVAMVVLGALPEYRNRVKFEANGVMTVAPETIDRVEIARAAARVSLARTAAGWSVAGGEALPAELAAKVSLVVQFMRTAAPVRVMGVDEIRGVGAAEFGLERPRLSIALFAGPNPVLGARFGGRNAEDVLQYMALDGSDALYLMSRFVGQEWEALFDALAPR